MAIETQDREIGGVVYSVTSLPAVKGRKVFARLFKLLGPAIEAVAKNGGKLDGAAALALLSENLGEDDLDFLCDSFAPLTRVDGNQDLSKTFTVHFAGNYLAMVQWLAFCVEHNFGSFFHGLGMKVPGSKSAQAAPEPKA